MSFLYVLFFIVKYLDQCKKNFLKDFEAIVRQIEYPSKLIKGKIISLLEEWAEIA